MDFRPFRRISGIYTISCPINNKVVYVGRCMNAQERFSNHISSSKNPRTKIAAWIKQILEAGYLPVFNIIHIEDDSREVLNTFYRRLKEAERRLIAFYYIQTNGELLNVVSINYKG